MLAHNEQAAAHRGPAKAIVDAVMDVGMLVAAPLIGFAYYVLFPFAASLLLLGVVGTGVVETLGWVRK